MTVQNDRVDGIEVAHAYFSGDSVKDFRLGMWHAKESRNVIYKYKLSYHTALLCLIDDQKFRRKQRHLLLPGIMGIRSIIELDYIVYETELNRYTKTWLALQQNEQIISGTIKREYNNSLQCSHYIAIWYCLRTGVLDDLHNVFIPVSKKACDGLVTPFGLNQVSILSDRNEPYEEMAKHKFLSQMKVSEPHINRLYYKQSQKDDNG